MNDERKKPVRRSSFSFQDEGPGMDEKAAEVVRKFVKKIKSDLSVDRVIFFGSRTGGDFLAHSDIDLLIVSDDFENIDYDDRLKMMYDYWDSEYDVDFLCYTRKEFKKKSKMITTAREAVRTGISMK
ncbi:MAG TPA: nucleotidyltransferase domain-containing protein [Planctomycetota bacterium]|nr:nucleotidyltransferase domain-containing protein [Planctomycetota bacterium]